MAFYWLHRKVFLCLFLSLLSIRAVAHQQTRSSFNIDVTHKGHGDSRSTEISVKAHLMEDLLVFLEVDMSNLTDITDILSTIPYQTAVDLSVAAADPFDPESRVSQKWLEKHVGSTLTQERAKSGLRGNMWAQPPPAQCMEYAPTYLFTFRRDDIIQEFGSEYFLLRPDTAKASKTIEALHPSRNQVTTENQRKKLWLHVPKTGSSFESTTTNLGYQDVTHDPCPEGVDCELITLFRQPYERLISWFYYDEGALEKCNVKSMARLSLSEYKEKLQVCFNDYLRENIYDGSATTTMFWGCEAKMAVGYHCDDAHIPSHYYKNKGADLTREALSNMRDENMFKFIGNTDLYDTSVTLAHQMIGGELTLSDGFHKVNSRTNNQSFRPNTKTGNPELDKVMYDADFLCKNNILCKNSPDEAVFQEVKRMMIENIFKHHNNYVRVFADPLPYEGQDENRVLNLPENLVCPKSTSTELPLKYIF